MKIKCYGRNARFELCAVMACIIWLDDDYNRSKKDRKELVNMEVYTIQQCVLSC